MAVREASIKATLRSGSFTAGIRKMVGTTVRGGMRMGKAISEPMKAGIRNAGKSMRSMLSSAADGMKQVATLGGAISVGILAKGAIDGTRAYIQLSDQLSVATKKTVTFAEAQALVDRVSSKTKGSLSETRDTLNQLAGIGDMKVIEEALERSTLQARRLGVETSLVARTTSRLLAKGIAKSAEEAELLVEQFNRFGRSVLGIDPDEAIDPSDMAEFAAFANAAGSNVGDLLTIMEQTGNTAKDMGQAFEIIEELGLVLNTRKGLKDLRKEAGLTKKEIDLSKGAVGNLLAILEKGSPKALQKFQDALGTDKAKQALGEILGKELSVNVGLGKATKEQISKRGEELEKQLLANANNTKEVARIQKKNAELLKDPAANIQDAMNRVQKAFAQPKMIAAIEKLANKLPGFADSLADVIGFIANNPLTSAGIAVGAKAGLSFGSGFVEEAGKSVGNKIIDVMKAGAPKLGSAIAQGFAPGKVGKTMGTAAGVVAAAAIGFEIGRRLSKFIEKDLDKAAQTGGSLIGATASAQAARLTGGKESRQKALGLLEGRITKGKQAADLTRTDVSASDLISGIFAGPLGLLLKRQGEASLATGSGELKKAEVEAAALRKSLKEPQQAARDLGKSMTEATTAIKNSSAAIRTTTRGPAKTPEDQPGAAPTSG